MLNAQDIQNAQIFLNRVELKGNEAIPMAELQMKLQALAQELEKPPEALPGSGPKPIESKK